MTAIAAPIKIMLVYDVLGWACGQECIAIKKHLEHYFPGEFDCTLRGASSAHTPKMLSDFDIVLSTLNYHLPESQHPRSVSVVASSAYWIRKSQDWQGLKEWKYIWTVNKYFRDKLTPEDHPRIELLYHTFDWDHWTPGPRESAIRKFTVGFAGHRQSCKGIFLIQEAVQSLPDVCLKTVTWEDNRIPYEEMPDFYRGLDAYVCMSAVGEDAGPRPPIEAGLCGIPVITTVVGQIGEMVKDGVNGLVIERDVVSLQGAIKHLAEGDTDANGLGLAARESFLREWVMPAGRAWGKYLKSIMEQG